MHNARFDAVVALHLRDGQRLTTSTIRALARLKNHDESDAAFAARVRDAALRKDHTDVAAALASPAPTAGPGLWPFLASLALGLLPADPRRRQLRDRDAWANAIVGRATTLWTGGPILSRSRLADAVVWRALQLNGAPQRNANAVRAHFLAQTLALPPSIDVVTTLRQGAARAIASPRTDSAALIATLARRFVEGEAWSDGATSFEAQVKAAAQHSTNGVLGHKVLIAALWPAVAGRPHVQAQSLDEFKTALLASHQRGALRLVRVDLAGAVDPALFVSSEITHHHARYHAVEREVHA